MSWRQPGRTVVAGVSGALIVSALIVSLTGPGTSPAMGADASELPPYHPSRLTGIGDARQVVVVTSASWSTSRARLRTYEQEADGVWVLSSRPVDARVGRYGFAPADGRQQGTSKTPAGTFALLRAFGTWADPGTALPYRRVDATDWWPYDPRDPATYNVWQHRRTSASDWRTTWAEDLSSYGRQYRHALVIDFNMPSGIIRAGGERLALAAADTRRGGGIFLHVDRPGATTGCVSIAQPHLRVVLRWLDPAKRPVIVMGPRSALSTL